jgi:hypothetical protein
VKSNRHRLLAAVAIALVAMATAGVILRAAWPSSKKDAQDVQRSGEAAQRTGEALATGDPVSYGQPVEIGREYSYASCS